MAAIGTVSSVFLVPGVSANGRLYTAEVIGRAVERMRARLADPDGQAITMLSHHAAGDDSTRLAANVVTCEVGADERARLNGYLIDTRAGRDIAAGIDPGPDGRRTLDSVSIRGWWLGPVRRVEYEGQWVETADDLEIDGIDFTKSPGVRDARISGSSRVTTETDARTPITESVEVTVMTDEPARRPSPADMPGARPPAEPAAETGAGTSPASEGTPPPAAAGTPVTRESLSDGARALVDKLDEAYAMISGWQGPFDVDLSVWGMTNDDVAATLAQLGTAYRNAMAVLDPDFEPGDADTFCAACSAAVAGSDKFCPQCGAQLGEHAPDRPHPAAETAPTKEDSVSDTTTSEGAPAADGATTEDTTATTTTGTATPGDGGQATGTAPAAGDTAAAGGEVPRLHPDDVAAIASAVQAGMTPAAAAAPAETTTPPPAPATEQQPAPPAAATEGTPPAAAAAQLTPEAVASAVTAGITAATSGMETRIRDAVRTDMVETYGIPARKGLKEAAQKAGADDAPDLSKLSPAEFQHAAGDVWSAVFGGLAQQ